MRFQLVGRERIWQSAVDPEHFNFDSNNNVLFLKLAELRLRYVGKATILSYLVVAIPLSSSYFPF